MGGKGSGRRATSTQQPSLFTVDNAYSNAFNYNTSTRSGFKSNELNNTDTELLTLNYVSLGNAYARVGIIAHAINLPIQDAFKNGIILESSDMDRSSIDRVNHNLNRAMPVKNVDMSLNWSNYRFDLHSPFEAVKLAMKWASLYGGGGIMIIDDSPLEEPFNLDMVSIKSNVGYRALNRWELTSIDGSYGSYTENGFYYYYGSKIHASRVILIRGDEAPHLLSQMLSGWGLSELERSMSGIDNYIKFNNLVLELLDEAKIDILKVDHLADSLSSDAGTATINRMMALIAKNKNYKSLIAIDTNDEYQQKIINFSGFKDIGNEPKTYLASILGIPRTKLFGEPSSGFSTGEDDIELYNTKIESIYRARARVALDKILPIVIKNALGVILPYTYSFYQLETLTEKEDEEIKTSKFNRHMKLFEAGILREDTLVEALKKDGLLEVTTAIEIGATRARELA